jgi:hypothetical protein
MQHQLNDTDTVKPTYLNKKKFVPVPLYPLKTPHGMAWV